jgi:hypothetical protein
MSDNAGSGTNRTAGGRYDEAFPHKEGQVAAASSLIGQLRPGARGPGRRPAWLGILAEDSLRYEPASAAARQYRAAGQAEQAERLLREAQVIEELLPTAG